MEIYVPRTLAFRNEHGNTEHVSDRNVTSLGRGLVILGEPGMGKTRLLQYLSTETGAVLRSAASFIEHPNPSVLVPLGSLVIIDGLDELAAAQESDPVHRVLRQLISAGCPHFVLSCRATDWRGAVARDDISKDYGTRPFELTIEPLSHDEAITLLAADYGRPLAESVVKTLEDRGVPELYGNPLTLKLFGEIGQQGDLPTTRADLLRRACALMWSERNDRHDRSPLSSLDADSALDAAGAVCAALILTGSEAVSTKPSIIGKPRVLPLGEVAALPMAEHARPIMGSRLFNQVSGTSDEFKPIHRSIAEYLGARWLAARASNPLICQRIRTMITVDSGVPASLRGIHAWLAHFSSALAPAVIETDPYGLLRYGDADGLSLDLGRLLLKTLKNLEARNPYFRAEDWTRQSARGITQPGLVDDLRQLLLADETSFHLRTVVLEAIRGSEAAAALRPELEAIMLGTLERTFKEGEREDAAEALIVVESDVGYWSRTIDHLIHCGDEDSTRLALGILSDVGHEKFSTTQIATAALACLGMLPTQTRGKDRVFRGDVYLLAERLPDSQLEATLDALVSAGLHRDAGTDWDANFELNYLVSHLVARLLDTGEVDPLKLLTWLKLAPERDRQPKEEAERITIYLQGNHATRRAIQHQVLFVERDQESARGCFWKLGRIASGLCLSADDIIYFLESLARRHSLEQCDVEIWRELASAVHWNDGRAAEIVVAAKLLANGNAALEAYLDELLQPRQPSEWEIEDERRRQKNRLEQETATAKARQDFGENEAALRAGELRWIYPVAMAYLGLFSDIDKSLPPSERIAQWLGRDLQTAAITGLEAVLHRGDLPTPLQLVDSYANSRRWKVIFPLIASAAEREVRGDDFSNLPIEVIITIRIGLHHEPTGDRIDTESLIGRLDWELRQDEANYERYIRTLIETPLQRGSSHVSGLYGFVRSETDRLLAVRLSSEWLTRFPDIHTGPESELVELLVDADDREALCKILFARRAHGLTDVKRRYNWDAVGVLVDFERTAASFGVVEAVDRDFLWHLQGRLIGDGREKRYGPKLSPAQLSWIVQQFRRHWPMKERPLGSSEGNTNDWQATDFIRAMINRLAADPSGAASSELASLISSVKDGYTPLLLYAADQQRRARRESIFSGIGLGQLKGVVSSLQPTSTRDLLAIVRFILGRFQAELRGSDTDPIKKYYEDGGRPRDENNCTDRLIEDLERLLSPFGIGRIPQGDMPADKRADVILTFEKMALPVECKGQWNPELWSAATTQLDALYSRDWRAQDCGLYIVYWFGSSVHASRRLRSPPSGIVRPQTALELQESLVATLPAERRESIMIEVIDFSR